jgi:prevent-host-death family protein
MLVMKQATQKERRPRRLGVAEAKSRLSELLRDAAAGPTIIHNRGRDLAVVLPIEEYDRLTLGHGERGAGARFLERVDGLKERHGGGIDDFAPPRLRLRPRNPFANRSGR